MDENIDTDSDFDNPWLCFILLSVYVHKYWLLVCFFRSTWIAADVCTASTVLSSKSAVYDDENPPESASLRYPKSAKLIFGKHCWEAERRQAVWHWPSANPWRNARTRMRRAPARARGDMEMRRPNGLASRRCNAEIIFR